MTGDSVQREKQRKLRAGQARSSAVSVPVGYAAPRLGKAGGAVCGRSTQAAGKSVAFNGLNESVSLSVAVEPLPAPREETRLGVGGPALRGCRQGTLYPEA